MLALGEGFQKVRSARWQVTTDTFCLMFQARGKPPEPGRKGLTLTHPHPQSSPSPAPLLHPLFVPSWWVWMQPRGQRQGGALPRRAHARALGWGWSKQTLLKGHFFRLWLQWPEEAAIIFQGCKCQKKNALSHSFPPCPWSASASHKAFPCQIKFFFSRLNPE